MKKPLKLTREDRHDISCAFDMNNFQPRLSSAIDLLTDINPILVTNPQLSKKLEQLKAQLAKAEILAREINEAYYNY
jgi:phosphatidylserine/phosphatidylglycerophosphate/cardiolipin synthase-like enzyme